MHGDHACFVTSKRISSSKFTITTNRFTEEKLQGFGLFFLVLHDKKNRPVSLQKLSKASTTIEHRTLLKFVANRGAAGNNKDLINNDVMTIISNIAIFFGQYFDIEKS